MKSTGKKKTVRIVQGKGRKDRVTPIGRVALDYPPPHHVFGKQEDHTKVRRNLADLRIRAS
jgi:site-specific recombinase XerD